MKLKYIILAGLAIVGLAVSPAIAQRHGWMGGFGAGHFRHNPERMLDHVSTMLDLTDAQKQFAKTLLADTKSQAEPVITQLKQGHESMAAAIKANRSDTEIGDIATRQGALVGQLSAIHAKAMAKFYAQLTPDQKTKADQVHDRIKSRFMGRFGQAE
jgi:Spy/CpxP family protein refolding chaperone